MGRSGAGKSTLLRALLGDRPTCSSGLNVNRSSLLAAGIGLVAQDQCLFPWYTVAQHMIFATKHACRSKPGFEIDELLEHVKLADDARHKYPDELSGGMRRRLMLAMAIAIRPNLIALDEAFSAVDAFTKADLVNVVCRYCDRSKATMVLASHDLKEVVAMATQIVCINAEGTLANVEFKSNAVGSGYDHPNSTSEADRLFIILKTMIGGGR